MTFLLLNDCGFLAPFGGLWVIHIVVSTFLAILFIQSGLDKMLDHKGNLDWLKGHFSSSVLAAAVPVLLALLTFMELVTGMLSAVGAVEAFRYHTYCFSMAGTLMASITLLALFFGQRVAKDYAGAASLVPYFIVVVIQLIFLV